MTEADALRLAQEAYRGSTQWVESSVRAEWEKNERQFQGRHPSGSKYYMDSYKYRSKSFRPKTRATIQSNEADCAFAFFSTANLCTVTAQDDNDPAQRASAKVLQEIVQYRLTETVPWMQIVVGGYQESQKHGPVIAHAYWEYRQGTKKEVMEGPLGTIEIDVPDVVCDQLKVQLVPIENIRFDPNADWTDPIGSSPYLVELVPMYVTDVLDRMAAEDPKTGEPKWKTLTKDQLRQTQREYESASLKEEREFDREDKETDEQLTDFDVIYIHRNFVRKNDEDWLFYTAGTQHLLSKPIKARDAYWHLRRGERPYVMGYSMMEAGKVYPGGVASLLRDVQQELNDSVNQRRDNVSLILNKRYLVRRSANVDYTSLRQNVPGSGTLVDDITRDITTLDTPDVTASSYNEEDRLAASFDDISGAFAPSSVATNKAMGETVGGMNIISSAANKVGDYRILIYAKTFVQPLLGQVLRLIQAYETDATVLAVAAQRAKIMQRFGIDQVTDELLRQELTATVSVGISSTDPTQKIQRLGFGLNMLGSVFGPETLQQLVKAEELIPEIFGNLGYQDGTRFFRNFESGEDPRIPQLMQQIQQLQQAIETKAVEEQGRNARMQELQDKKTRESLLKTNMQGQYRLQETAMKEEGEAARFALGAMMGGPSESQ
jgi:hypothetical protein